MTANAVLKGIKSAFMSWMQTEKVNQYSPLIQEVNSLNNKEDYIVFETLPTIKELLDVVEFPDVSDKKYTIENKEFYNSIQEDRNLIEDSKEYLGANVESQLKSIANEWQDFNDVLCETLLSNSTHATKGLAFDGTTFFSTTRPNIQVGSTGISNFSTGTGTTLLTIFTDYGTNKTLLKSFKDKNGRPFNRNPDMYVVIPPALEDTFRQILSPTATTFYSSSGVLRSNPYAGDAKIIVDYASTGSDWYLINAKSKPFVIQNRKNPEWFMDDNQKTKYVQYYMKGRKGYGYGNPMGVVKVSNA